VQSIASWAGLICHTHQHYHRQWLSNTEWSNSRRSAWARQQTTWWTDNDTRCWSATTWSLRNNLACEYFYSL